MPPTAEMFTKIESFLWELSTEIRPLNTHHNSRPRRIVKGSISTEKGVLMRKLITAATLGLSVVLAPLVVAPAAQASCNDTDWTWPFCHIGRPSIPRFDMGGPRPPLTPKNSVWCTAALLSVGNGVGWYRISTTKYNIRFWPDYYHHVFVGVVWNGTGWVQTPQPVYTSADCDA
jgi:hypothetical protein